MKKLKKLTIKKVTLRDLDEQTLQGIAGGLTDTPTCPGPNETCKTCALPCTQTATNTAKVGQCCC
jgi:natural product precursor